MVVTLAVGGITTLPSIADAGDPTALPATTAVRLIRELARRRQRTRRSLLRITHHLRIIRVRHTVPLQLTTNPRLVTAATVGQARVHERCSSSSQRQISRSGGRRSGVDGGVVDVCIRGINTQHTEPRAIDIQATEIQAIDTQHTDIQLTDTPAIELQHTVKSLAKSDAPTESQLAPCTQ